MGHVPAGPAAQAGPRDDVPGREHRGAGAPRLQGPRALGAFGERLAAAFLERRGAQIVAANHRIGHDEVDLLAVHRGERIVVEVKARVAADPMDEFTDEQAARLRRAAAALNASRCDLIAVRVTRHGVQVRWVPGAC